MSFIDKGHSAATRGKYGALHYVIVFLMVAFFVFMADRLYAATTLSGNVITDGLIMASSTLDITGSSTLYSTLQVGGYLTSQNYNIVANADGTAASQSAINTDNDLFVEGSFEADGLSYFDGGLISTGSSTVAGALTGTGRMNFGGVDSLAYNAISDAAGVTTHGTDSGLMVVSSDDALYIEGVLEVDGGAWFDNNVTSTAGGFHIEDNIQSFFGTGNDASIYYNGTNMVINPDVVGTGYVLIEGTDYLSLDVLGDTHTSGTIARASSTVAGNFTVKGRITAGGTGDYLAYNAIADADGVTDHATSAEPVSSDDDLFVEGSLEVNGTLFLDNASSVSSTGVFAFGGGTILAYNAISDAAGVTTHGTNSGLMVVSSDDDLYIEGVLEVDGGAWFDNNVTSTAGGFHNEDNIKSWFGAKNRASIYHDGTDLIFTNLIGYTTIQTALSVTGVTGLGGVLPLLAYNAISDAAGVTTHGTGSGGFILDSDDDLYIEGVLEVDGGLWLDNHATSTAGGLHFEDSIKSWFGTNNDASITYDGSNLVFTTGLSSGIGDAIFASGTIARASSTVIGDLTVGDDLFVDVSAGKVGVNTTTPNSTTNIYSTGTSTLKLETDGASRGGCLAIEMSTSTAGTGFIYCIAQVNGNLSCSTTSCETGS